MRYTSIERYGGTTVANKQLVTSEYFKKKATKDKNPTSAADGILYYMSYFNLATIYVPETHPLFNYPMLVYSDGYSKIHKDRVNKGGTTLGNDMMVMLNKFGDSLTV